MSTDWPVEISFDGVAFRGEVLPTVDSVGEVTAIVGLPQRFLDDLVRMSQVVSVPHTWRVRETSSVDEVGSDDIVLGRHMIENDIVHMGATIICYLICTDGAYSLVAAGALRNKLTKTFGSDEFPVVSRAVVDPRLRGRGVGSLMVRHRLKLAEHFYSAKTKAVSFGTEAPQILAAAKKHAGEAGHQLVHIGVENYEAADGFHKVDDYMLLLRPYHIRLASEAEAASGSFLPTEFETNFAAWLDGDKSVSGDHLSAQVAQAARAVAAPVELLTEFFDVRSQIGASDPI